MDWLELKSLLPEAVKKYRLAALVLLLGIVLLMMPGKTKESSQLQPQTPPAQSQDPLQQQLEELLSRLEGAGKVKVLLSPRSGAQTYYQTDEDESRTADTAERRTQTVMVTSSDRSQSGLVVRVDPPAYLGAVVLCQGGDRPGIRLAVVEAVSAVTGLTSDKISVGKMK